MKEKCKPNRWHEWRKLGKMKKKEGRKNMEPVLEVKNIEKYYGNKSNLTKAIDHISFQVEKGEFVGIMGASG